jgi:hypothetical protein
MTTLCVLPGQCVPQQYIGRAAEAKKILTVDERSTQAIASHVALAELAQVIFFIAQTTIYALAYFQVISPLSAGIVAFVLLPIEGFAAYHTFIHYKTITRILMTIAAIVTLAICAGLACAGIVKDSAITLCVGGIALHVIRNLTECCDAQNAFNNQEYIRNILDRSDSSKTAST